MQYARKFFQVFDMFTAPATLRARQQAQTSSMCAGVVSFLAAALFFYLFISSMVSTIQYGQITSSQTETKLLGDQVQANGIMFALMVNYLNASEVVKYFSIDVTAFAIENIYTISMQACTADQWKLLGDGYMDIFSQYDLAEFLCPTSTDNLNLEGTFKKSRIKQIKILVQPCGTSAASGGAPPTNTTTNTTTNSSSTCYNTSYIQTYINNSISTDRSLIAQLYFLDQSINASSKIPVSYFVNNDNRLSFTSRRGVDSTVEFGSFQITTDVSLMPWNQESVVTGNFVDKLKDSTFEIDTFGSNPYAVFTMIMNRRMIYVNRTVGKIDAILSYVGGLFSIIIAFLGFFMMSYNQYRYELMVAQGTFNYDEDGKKIRESDFHFHTYVKYCVYDWIKTMGCCQPNWQHCKQIDQTRQQANCQMDVIRLFRKIRNLETSILYLMDENERMCLTLFEPPALPEVRKNRLITEYYDAIIGGEPAVTVEDVKILGDALRLGLGMANKKKNKGVDNGGMGETDGSKGHNRVGSMGNLFQLAESDQSRPSTTSDPIKIKIAQDRSNILQVVLTNFPEYGKMAQNIQLPQELIDTEAEIAKSFFNMDPKTRAKIQEKIPLIIIHRLKMRMDQINATQKEFNIDLG